MEINAGFTLVGQDVEESETDLTDAAPATVIPIDQEVYLEAGEPFEPGEHVGEAHGTAVLTHRDRFVCQVTFTFDADPDDSIVLHGTLPREGGGIGGGHIAVTGGTGKFHKAAGSVAVETRNPKRWIFSL
jgi:hypothetical protein